jgi:hypothetical protein
MSNTTPSRIGQALGTGAADALFLKLFSGEVMTIFEAENVTKGRTMVRTIANGKSSQFPVMGRATASYHVPGNEILGGTIKHNERVITIDDLLIAPVFLADIDEAMNHYEVRSHYSTEVGRVLAQVWDRQVLQVGVLAARTSTANIPGEGVAGTVITEAVLNDYNDPDKLAAAFYAAAQTFDEKNIPEQDRVCYLKPSAFYRLIQSDKTVNRDFGGQGDRTKGTIHEIAGIEIVKTNNLPTTNISAGVQAGTGSKYIGDFTKTEALFMHKSAIGTVQLMDLSTRSDYDPRRVGTQILSRLAVGHGVLRPEAAIELRRL